MSLDNVRPSERSLWAFARPIAVGIQCHARGLKNVNLYLEVIAMIALTLGQNGWFDRADLEKTYVSPIKSLKTVYPAAEETLPLSIGFYVTWDPRSYAALKLALPHIDWLIPGWFNLTGSDLTLSKHVDGHVTKLLNSQKPSMSVLPMVQNADQGNWNGTGLAQLLGDPSRRNALLAQILAGVKDFSGVTIDFELIPRDAHPNLRIFLAELKSGLQARAQILILAVPLDDDDWNYTAYAEVADFLLLMAYDEHFADGSPGSVAGEEWFKRKLAKRMATLDPSRTIISLGNYGYDWARDGEGVSVSFEQIRSLAADSEAFVEVDPQSGNPHFSYVGEDGEDHEVWFLDAGTRDPQSHLSPRLLTPTAHRVHASVAISISTCSPTWPTKKVLIVTELRPRTSFATGPNKISSGEPL